MRSEIYRYFPYPPSYTNQTEQVESVVSVRVAGDSGRETRGRIPGVMVGGFGFQECDFQARVVPLRSLQLWGESYPSWDFAFSFMKGTTFPKHRFLAPRRVLA